ESALSAEARDVIDTQIEQRLGYSLQQVDRLLPRLRLGVDSGRVETLRVIDGYSLMLDNIIKVFSGMVIVNDLEIFEQGRALISVGNARAFMLREDALVTAALANGGKFKPAEHLAFIQSVAMGQREMAAGMNDLNSDLRGPLERLQASEGYKNFRAMETAITSSPDARIPAQAANWQATTPRLS
ncbi:nitrate- and nitrite sensing domain-containing protein, partial [Actinomadura adrarensis]